MAAAQTVSVHLVLIKSFKITVPFTQNWLPDIFAIGTKFGLNGLETDIEDLFGKKDHDWVEDLNPVLIYKWTNGTIDK